MRAKILKNLIDLFELHNAKVLLISVLLMTTMAYGPSLQSDFTNWDDDWHLTENESVRSLSWENLKVIFTKPVVLTYIPLTILSFAFEYHFFQYNPLIYHLDNLILHLSVVGLIFALALQLRLTLPAAALGALIFGIHPMHVESVAWVTERKDVLYSFFYLSALMFYIRHIDGKGRGFYLASIVCALLSILSKPMAYSLPLGLFLMDWMWGRKLNLRSVVDKVPHFLIILFVSWLTLSRNLPVVHYRWDEVVLIWIWSFVFHLWKFFIPLEMLPLYGLSQPISLFNSSYILSLITFVTLCFLIVKYWSNRLFIFAVFFYSVSICLIVFRSVWDFGNATIVADRFMYLPSLGFCLWLGVVFGEEIKKRTTIKRFKYFMIVLILMLLAGKTFVQCQIWKNSLTLWTYVMEKSPRQSIAYNNRGLFYRKTGQLDLAMVDYNRAIELNLGYVEAYNNRGNLFALKGEYDQAIADYAKALMIDPDFSPSERNRALVLQARDFTKPKSGL